jgi:uncharacterized RDD family membrane protein YckC
MTVPEAPPLRRRLACFLYEGVLLFGVVMLTGLLYAGLFQQRHALQGQLGLQLFVVLVLGMYFVAFWTRGRQTLPMKTWHIRLVTTEGGPVGPIRATARYLLSWIWFLPALLVAHLAGIKSTWELAALIAAGVLAYAALVWLHPSRQFWHDIACGTRLIDTRARAVSSPGGSGTMPTHGA